jgi:hypothetical protein
LQSKRCSTNLHGGDSSGDNDNEAAWDADVEYDKEWPQQKAPPDPSTAWDAIPIMPEAARLGIDISLKPLNEQEAAEIKKEAQEIINSRIDEGIQDIERLRKKMSKEMEQSRKIMEIASELEAKRKSDELMKKIDRMTGAFLDSTKETRTSTKMAAAASRAMEGSGKGLEVGTWGTLSGRTVIASNSGSLLGSVDYAANEEQKQTAGTDSAGTARTVNRILVVADIKEVRLVLGCHCEYFANVADKWCFLTPLLFFRINWPSAWYQRSPKALKTQTFHSARLTYYRQLETCL